MPTITTILRRLSSLRNTILDQTLRQTAYMIRCGRLSPRASSVREATPPIFVLSTGRTGTQTLAALFALTSRTHAYHEPKPLLYGLGRIAYLAGDCKAARQMLGQALGLARGYFLESARQCGARYVETSPQVTFVCYGLRDLAPNAKFIHLVRDPRDVVRSAMRRNWYAGNIADETRIAPSVGSARESWDEFTPFDKNLWLWTETNRWIAEFCDKLPASEHIRIRSEDVFTADATTLAKLYGFIDRQLPRKHKIDRLLAKNLNSQLTGVFPRADDWDPDAYQRLVDMCGATAETYGYEL